jgi:cyanate permease
VILSRRFSTFRKIWSSAVGMSRAEALRAGPGAALHVAGALSAGLAVALLQDPLPGFFTTDRALPSRCKGDAAGFKIALELIVSAER